MSGEGITPETIYYDLLWRWCIREYATAPELGRVARLVASLDSAELPDWRIKAVAGFVLSSEEEGWSVTPTFGDVFSDSITISNDCRYAAPVNTKNQQNEWKGLPPTTAL